MTTPYVKQTWADTNPSFPLSAARMLVLESGIFDAHYRPYVRVGASANPSIPNSAMTTVAFDTEAYDTDNIHSTTVNNSRLTATTAGFYSIGGTLSYTANATGYRALQILLNGATVLAGQGFVSSALSQSANWLNVSTMMFLSAADFVEVQTFQSSGGALVAGTPLFWMALVSY